MRFEVRNVALAVPFSKAFDYLSDITKLPEWTHAFAEVTEDGYAVMRTSEGEVRVRVQDMADRDTGVIDTEMTFPDGTVGIAYSRLLPLGDDACAYSFLLTPPPGPLEELEGALSEQARILAEELLNLKVRLESA